MFSPSTCVLVAVLSLAAASAVPATGHDQLANAFVQAVDSLDFASASKLYADILSQGHMDACAFRLAASIKTAIKSEHYEQLSEDDKHQLEALKNQLPDSVRNVVFAASICIANADKQEYLFSPTTDYIYSPDKRNVFLWRSGGAVDGSIWMTEDTATPDEFKIVNEYGEFLFADNTHYFVNRRNVFTYIPTVWTGFTNNVWKFIPNGNQMVLQNLWYSSGSVDTEFLYAAAFAYNFDADRGRVFDWDGNWAAGDVTNLWNILVC